MQIHQHMLNAAESNISPAASLPLLLRDLGSWQSVSQQITFMDWCVNQVCRQFQVTARIATQWIHGGFVDLLLDGLDEITDDKSREYFLEGLCEYLNTRSKTRVIITSRTDELKNLHIPQQFERLQLERLSIEIVKNQMNSMGFQTSNIALLDVLRQPLMLNILSKIATNPITFTTLKSDNSNLDLYQELFDRFIKHSLKSLTEVRDGLLENLLINLRFLASHLARAEKQLLYLEEINESWLIGFYPKILFSVFALGIGLFLGAIQQIFVSISGLVNFLLIGFSINELNGIAPMMLTGLVGSTSVMGLLFFWITIQVPSKNFFKVGIAGGLLLSLLTVVLNLVSWNNIVGVFEIIGSRALTSEATLLGNDIIISDQLKGFINFLGNYLVLGFTMIAAINMFMLATQLIGQAAKPRDLTGGIRWSLSYLLGGIREGIKWTIPMSFALAIYYIICFVGGGIYGMLTANPLIFGGTNNVVQIVKLVISEINSLQQANYLISAMFIAICILLMIVAILTFVLMIYCLMWLVPTIALINSHEGVTLGMRNSPNQVLEKYKQNARIIAVRLAPLPLFYTIVSVIPWMFFYSKLYTQEQLRLLTPLFAAGVVSLIGQSIAAGLSLAIACGLIYGGRLVIKQITTRLALRMSKLTQGDIVDSIELAAKHGLLVRRNGGYSFQHRLLQEHFASINIYDLSNYLHE